MGKQLHEVMGWQGPIAYLTHRQYLSWGEWFLIEKNRPGRLEHYIMQLTMHVAAIPYMFSNAPPAFNLDSFRITFKVQTEQDFNPEGSKQIWLGILKASSRQNQQRIK